MRFQLLESFFNEFKSSIKSPDTEEKIDLVLYRPFGYIIAKVANSLGMSPTNLSLLGLFFGLLAGYYYFHLQNNLSLTIAGFFLVLSGIFDSADGQLARISNQSTKIGLVLDGICDSLVTIAVYVSCSWPYFLANNYLFIIIVSMALYLHSCQCAILDFYHREYLFFGYGKIQDDTYWNPGVKDGLKNIVNSASKFEKIINKLRLTWIRKQQFLSSRNDDERSKMRDYLFKCNISEKKFFMETYKKHNLWLLPLWRLVGVNAHTFLIFIFMFIRRFDLYLIAFDLIIFNIIIFIVGRLQKKADELLFLELKLNPHDK